MEPLSLKILIVYDEEMVRNLLVSLLSKRGHKCETAKDGIEALKKSKRIPLIQRIDVVMPLMDGITFYQGIV